jgi:hypothetical protein
MTGRSIAIVRPEAAAANIAGAFLPDQTRRSLRQGEVELKTFVIRKAESDPELLSS